MQWELSRLSSIATVVNGYPFDSQYVGKEKEHLWCGFAIDHLREYLTRLIADIVTGKLDMREAAAELPEVDPLAEDDLDSTIHDRENSNLGELDAEESAEEYTCIAHRPMNIYIVLHRNCEAATMKNITVSIDEQTHRLARIRAAELDTSVSALVRDYLRHLAAEPDAGGEASAESSETIYQRRCRLLREVLADFDGQGIGLRMSDNLPREALYDRVAARAEAVAECERQRSISEALKTSPCDS